MELDHQEERNGPKERSNPTQQPPFGGLFRLDCRLPKSCRLLKVRVVSWAPGAVLFAVPFARVGKAKIDFFRRERLPCYEKAQERRRQTYDKPEPLAPPKPDAGHSASFPPKTQPKEVSVHLPCAARRSRSTVRPLRRLARRVSDQVSAKSRRRTAPAGPIVTKWSDPQPVLARTTRSAPGP
jgi:hypothetical protein